MAVGTRQHFLSCSETRSLLHSHPPSCLLSPCDKQLCCGSNGSLIPLVLSCPNTGELPEFVPQYELKHLQVPSKLSKNLQSEKQSFVSFIFLCGQRLRVLFCNLPADRNSVANKKCSCPWRQVTESQENSAAFFKGLFSWWDTTLSLLVGLLFLFSSSVLEEYCSVWLFFYFLPKTSLNTFPSEK